MAKHGGKYNGVCPTVCYTESNGAYRMILLLAAIFLSFFTPFDRPVLLEGYFAGILALLLGITIRRMPKNIGIHARLFWLWCYAIGVMTMLTLFSADRALSLLAVIRLLEGFAAFFIASLWVNHLCFPRYMVVLGSITACCFLALFFFPALRAFIPPYNGIIAINGHHPVIYTVMMTLPFFFTVSFTFMRRISIGSIIALTVLFSAARGAWIVLSGFLIPTAIVHRKGINRSAVCIWVIVLSLLVGITTIGTATLSDTAKERIRTAAPLLAGFTKDTNLVMRREYAMQAFRAFIDAPLTGHGPGSFPLLSKTYQSQPGRFARYAHSFPLELLAETGLAGLASVGTLIFVAAVVAHRALKTKKYRPYGAAALLSIAYGIIDTPLQSLPHWILLWGIIGVAAPRAKRSFSRMMRMSIIVIWIVLTMFFISFSSSHLLAMRDNRSAFRIAPYNPAIVLAYGADKLTPRDKHYLLWWHGADTEMLFVMAKHDPSLYPHIIRLAPKNTRYLAAYLTLLAETKDVAAIAELLCNPSVTAGNGSCPLYTSAPFRRFVNETPYFRETIPYLSGDDGYGKFFYFLGTHTFTHTGDRDVTLFLWQKAMELAPEWAFYYLEVAGAQYHWFGDTASARQTVERCLAHPSAQVGCINADDGTTLLAPGLYSRDIMRIPALQ